MTRTLKLFAAMLLMTLCLGVSASAADFEPVAQELSTIGMFKGTGTGFELDRAPTRAEAAIMLVRLYGAEESASTDYAAGTISHPFADVPAYAAPHVAWLYTEGLTKGVSADRFGSADLCTAQSYATFLLRALGYADGVDFAYADALAFAEEKGFYLPEMFPGEFLRDDLAALTYQALATDTAEGGAYLLAQLVETGAVEQEAAAPMMEKMDLVRKLSELEQPLSGATELSVITIVSDSYTAADGTLMESYGTTMGSVKTIPNDDGLELSCEMISYAEDTIEGETSLLTAVWLKDGWVYQYVSNGALTQTVKYIAEDEAAVLEGLNIPQIPGDGINVVGLAMMESAVKEKDGSDTVYTVTFADGFGGLLKNMDSLIEQLPESDGIADFDMTIGKVTTVYIADRRDNLKGIILSLPYTMTMEIYGETVTHHYDMNISMAVAAIGKDVRIEYPDFSYFAEIDPPLSETPAA